MSKTYFKGRFGFKRMDHKHGHCFICGWDKKESMKRKTNKKKILQLDILPYLEDFIQGY